MTVALLIAYRLARTHLRRWWARWLRRSLPALPPASS